MESLKSVLGSATDLKIQVFPSFLGTIMGFWNSKEIINRFHFSSLMNTALHRMQLTRQQTSEIEVLGKLFKNGD
jgi:hypothetical protein